jgi:hypothetical protein
VPCIGLDVITYCFETVCICFIPDECQDLSYCSAAKVGKTLKSLHQWLRFDVGFPHPHDPAVI